MGLQVHTQGQGILVFNSDTGQVVTVFSSLAGVSSHSLSRLANFKRTGTKDRKGTGGVGSSFQAVKF